MKLIVKKANISKDRFPHVEVHIKGTPEQADLIKAIDNAIGNEIKSYDANDKAYTWYQECSDYCAEYDEGSGCGWIFDEDDLDEFKSLWKKHKSLSK